MKVEGETVHGSNPSTPQPPSLPTLGDHGVSHAIFISMAPPMDSVKIFGPTRPSTLQVLNRSDTLPVTQPTKSKQ